MVRRRHLWGRLCQSFWTKCRAIRLTPVASSDTMRSKVRSTPWARTACSTARYQSRTAVTVDLNLNAGKQFAASPARGSDLQPEKECETPGARARYEGWRDARGFAASGRSAQDHAAVCRERAYYLRDDRFDREPRVSVEACAIFCSCSAAQRTKRSYCAKFPCQTPYRSGTDDAFRRACQHKNLRTIVASAVFMWYPSPHDAT